MTQIFVPRPSVPAEDATPKKPAIKVFRQRLSNTGAVGPAVTLTLMAVLYFYMRPSVLSFDGIHTILNAGTALALAAAGAGLVTVVGGFDFSVGAAISVVNVIVATQVGESVGSQLVSVLLALLVGLLIGLVNSILVIRFQIASVVATLAASFFWGGIALLILAQPGGVVPPSFAQWFTGDVGGIVPNAAILLFVVVAAWLVLKRTRLGHAFYAVGGNVEAARLNGINVSGTIIAAYMIAGLLYGLSGLFITALTSSGDPNIGAPLLLPAFAAIAIGGIRFGGGRGELTGAIVGAFILYMISDLLYAFGVNSFYTPIMNGIILVVAVAITAYASDRRWRESSWLGRTVHRIHPTRGKVVQI